MSKVFVDKIEKRTVGVEMDVPASGKWPQGNIADQAVGQSQLATDAVGTTQLSATGTASGSTFLRGDNVWGTIDTAGLQDDIAILGFQVAAASDLALYNLSDQIVDTFQDATGVDAAASINEGRNEAGKYYFGGTAAPTITSNHDDTGTDGDYTWYRWTTVTSSGSFQTTTAQDYEYLVVAGGGQGGGNYGGGGGAGGYRANNAYNFPVAADTAHNITVGAGGTGGDGSGSGGDGGDSVFSTITSTGGGGGGGNGGTAPETAGRAGGSGGGGGESGAPGTGNSPSTSPVQGYDGSDGQGQASDYMAGSGGGASQAGIRYVDNSIAGVGGAGLQNDIDGTNYYYSGGGGGSTLSQGPSSNAGPGGAGGGGGGNVHSGGGGSQGTGGAGRNTGGAGTTGGGGGDGGANTGGGGGGSHVSPSIAGGTGGSGIVIIKRLTGAATPGLDLTLVSTANTAQTEPTKGDVVLIYTPATGTTTLNTDIKGYVSRDNGTTYTEATLVGKGSYSGTTEIASIHDLDISAQPAGTSMRWKVTTHNQGAGTKITYVNGVSLGWS